MGEITIAELAEALAAEQADRATVVDVRERDEYVAGRVRGVVSIPSNRRSSTVCRPVACKTCRKTTWAGCGMHVSQVLAGVPQDQRCPGHPKLPRAEGGGLLKRLFRRG